MNYDMNQILSKLSTEAIIGIMWDALSDMQHYNGQGMNTVIAKAMGATITENEEDECLRAKFPSIAEIEERGKNSPLF